MTRTAVLAALAVLTPSLLPGYPLTDAQREHLQRYLPNSCRKLVSEEMASDKDDYRILVMGDSISDFFHHDANIYDSLDSYHGRLAQRMEREFFFTGGVRLVKPKGGLEAWPILTVRGGSDQSMVTGSDQPNTHLLQIPRCEGMDWKIGPLWLPVLIRAQNSTSLSPVPRMS